TIDAAVHVVDWRSPPTPFEFSPKNTNSAAIAPTYQTSWPKSLLWNRLKRSSFSNTWRWPSEPPRIPIESQLDSRSGRYTCAVAAWPASWIAVARASCSWYWTLIAEPDSITVIASTRSFQLKNERPVWCAFVSAIEQIWSIWAGE